MLLSSCLLGVMVTVMTVIKTSDIGVSGEVSEPLQTNPPFYNPDGMLYEEEPSHTSEGPGIANTEETPMPGDNHLTWEPSHTGEGHGTDTTGEPIFNGENLSTRGPFVTDEDPGTTNTVETPIYGDWEADVTDVTPETTKFQETPVPGDNRLPGEPFIPSEGAASMLPFRTTTPADNNATPTFPRESFREENLEIPDLLTCCDDFLCTFAFGENSYCEPKEDGNHAACSELNSEIETVGTTPEGENILIMAGVCTCEPGYWLQNGLCDNQERPMYKCCTDQDCHSAIGVSSECVNMSRGNPEFCPSFEPGPFRPKREAHHDGTGIGTTPRFETRDDYLVGDCACLHGYEMTRGICMYVGTLHSSSSTPGRGDSLHGNTSGSDTGSEEPVTVANSTPFTTVCYDWRCSGSNCTERLEDVHTYCHARTVDVCYLSKQCSEDGFTYIFGCEDPCANQTSSGSHDCFAVTCVSRFSVCNNDTSLVEQYECNSGNLVLLPINLIAVLTIMVIQSNLS